MSSADLAQGARRFGGRASLPGAAPTDYHALGTFSETWTFLELFLDRCISVVGAGSGQDGLLGLEARLDALNAAVRLDPNLAEVSEEVCALTAEIHILAIKRRAVLEGVARASLSRLGMNLFAIPSGAFNAVPSPFGHDETIDALHMKTCDLVRRSLLLFEALEAQIGD